MVCSACFGAGTSSAATLYTNAAHAIPVPVGTTFTASITEPTGANEWGYIVDSSPFGSPKCKGGSYAFKVTQNSGGTFKAAITGGSFVGCQPYSLSVEPAGELKVEGSSIAVGSNKDWLGTHLFTIIKSPPINYTGGFTPATGNPPANGIYTQQPAIGTPVSVVLTRAYGLIGGPATVSRVTGTYVFRGVAAAYSFN